MKEEIKEMKPIIVGFALLMIVLLAFVLCKKQNDTYNKSHVSKIVWVSDSDGCRQTETIVPKGLEMMSDDLVATPVSEKKSVYRFGEYYLVRKTYKNYVLDRDHEYFIFREKPYFWES